MYNCCCMLLLSSHEFWDLISQGLTRGKKNAIRDRQSLVNNLLLLCNPKKCVGALLYVDNIHDNPSIYYVILVTTPSPQLFCKQEQDGWASGYGCKLLTIGYSACAARVTVVVLCVYVCLLQRNQRNAVSDVKVKVWTQYKLNNLHFRLNFFYKTAFLPRNSHVTICIVLSELPFVAHTYQLWRTWSATLSFCHSNVSIYNVWLAPTVNHTFSTQVWTVHNHIDCLKLTMYNTDTCAEGYAPRCSHSCCFCGKHNNQRTVSCSWSLSDHCVFYRVTYRMSSVNHVSRVSTWNNFQSLNPTNSRVLSFV